MRRRVIWLDPQRFVEPSRRLVVTVLRRIDTAQAEPGLRRIGRQPGGFLERRKLATLSVFFALTTPVGALLAYLFFRTLSETDVAVAIGISAGTFLAIATADILPQVHRIEQRNPMTLICLVLGLAVSWISRIFAH